MSKSNDTAVSVPSVSGSTEAMPVAVTSKGSRCPDWCVVDHDTGPESGATGYTCATALTVLTLPATGKYNDNPLIHRQHGENLIRVGRALLTVEKDDEGGQPGSTNETIVLDILDIYDNDVALGLNEEETRLLIQLLAFHADRLAANRVSS